MIKKIIDWFLSLFRKEKSKQKTQEHILSFKDKPVYIKKTSYQLFKEMSFWKRVAHRRMRRNMEKQTHKNEWSMV